MILRVIRGRSDREHVEALRSRLEPIMGPRPVGAEPLRLHLGVRPVGDAFDVIILVFWSSPEPLGVADARRESPLLIGRALGLELEPQHFEVSETVRPRSDEEPVALRLATGRFSKPGADIEMQDLLRQRAPLVGDDMTEAYIGRRLHNGAIEVTFVSAWRRIPSDRRLEDTFWPDIALRYDEFHVEVYMPLPPLGG